MKKHPLIHTLLTLKGNPRACVYTEPLWGIPFNLYYPFFSVFLLALGINDKQIGMIASIGFVSQIIFSLLGGVITDQLGRKKTTFIFDILSWSVPCLIWAFSSNFMHFIIAALINGMLRITANSWVCLLVEDANQDQLIPIYTWISIANLLAAFFAPITGLVLLKFDLIPTMRGMFLLSFTMMTIKFLILGYYSKETAVGKKRMAETKGISLINLLKGYLGVLKTLFKTRNTLFVLSLMIVLSITNMVISTFLGIVITDHLMLPTGYIAYIPLIKSVVMLIFFFTIVPKLNLKRFKKPLLVGFTLVFISQIILVTAAHAYSNGLSKGFLILGLFATLISDACGLSLINPLMESLQVILVDVTERARIIGLLFVVVLLFTSPFGYIAGTLSAIHRLLPFVMNILFMGLAILLILGFNPASDRPQESL